MNGDDRRELVKLIGFDIELDQKEGHTDQQDLLLLIAQRVKELLEEDAGLLFSYLYRLDVSEQKVRSVMDNDNNDKVIAIAQLILDRQLQRLNTKKTLKQKPIQGWEW